MALVGSLVDAGELCGVLFSSFTKWCSNTFKVTFNVKLKSIITGTNMYYNNYIENLFKHMAVAKIELQPYYITANWSLAVYYHSFYFKHLAH